MAQYSDSTSAQACASSSARLRSAPFARRPLRRSTGSACSGIAPSSPSQSSSLAAAARAASATASRCSPTGSPAGGEVPPPSLLSSEASCALAAGAQSLPSWSCAAIRDRTRAPTDSQSAALTTPPASSRPRAVPSPPPPAPNSSPAAVWLPVAELSRHPLAMGTSTSGGACARPTSERRHRTAAASTGVSASTSSASDAPDEKRQGGLPTEPQADETPSAPHAAFASAAPAAPPSGRATARRAHLPCAPTHATTSGQWVSTSPTKNSTSARWVPAAAAREAGEAEGAEEQRARGLCAIAGHRSSRRRRRCRVNPAGLDQQSATEARPARKPKPAARAPRIGAPGSHPPPTANRRGLRPTAQRPPESTSLLGIRPAVWAARKKSSARAELKQMEMTGVGREPPRRGSAAGRQRPPVAAAA
eukprot:scaffold8455_cov104-Isochrysis_galbana.AAC.4